MKYHVVLLPVPNVVIEWHVVWGVVSGIDNTDFIDRDDVSSVQVRDVHTEHPDHISAVHSECAKPVKTAVGTVKAFISEISLPPSKEFALR